MEILSIPYVTEATPLWHDAVIPQPQVFQFLSPLAQSSVSQSHKHLHNPLSGLSVPFFGNTSFFPLAGKQLFHSGLYGFGIGTDQFVGALDNGFRTLCIVPQG